MLESNYTPARYGLRRLFRLPFFGKPSATPDFDKRLTRAKDILSTVQSLATILALLLGAFWFIEQRQRYPRLKIEPKISHLPFGDKTLVVVDTALTNVGNVVIRLQTGEVRMSQVLPRTTRIEDFLKSGKLIAPQEHEPRWDELESRATEPRLLEAGEADSMHDEFVIACDVQAVSVYVYLKNPYISKEFGWSETKLYSVEPRPNCK